MKLIIIQPYLNIRGGVERVILEIAKHYDAKIYTLEYNKSTTFEDFSKLDINIVGKDVPLSSVLPYRASQGLRYGYNFYNMVVKEGYDVLNPHISPSEWIRHKNKRVVWFCHTPPREVYDLYETRMAQRSYRDKVIYSTMTNVYKFIASGITKRIEQIVANSENTRQRINKYYSRDAAVVNPGINYQQFRNDGDKGYFLYPSRIVINKRQDYVMQAFKQFSKASKKSHRLVIAGTLSNDPEHLKYFEKLKKMASGMNVTFKTNPDERQLKDLYAGSTAVLFAAINEDFGIVPLEAMASSKPIIATNEGGPRETVLNDKTGYLVDSISGMAEKMRLVAEHADLAEKLGSAGRKRVIDNYSWPRFFEKLDPIMRKAARGKDFKM